MIRQFSYLAVAAAMVSLPAAAAEPGFYMEGRIGAASAKGGSVPQQASVILDVSGKTGAAFSAAVGYQTGGSLRLEAELGYHTNAVEGRYEERIMILIFPPCGQPNRPCIGPAVEGRIKAPSVMFSGIYDIPLSHRWRLGLGLGAGITAYGLDVHANGTFLDGTSRRIDIVDGKDQVLSARATAEVAYALTRHEVIARYAVTTTQDADFSGRGNLGFNYEQNLTSHAFSVGVRYRF